VGTRQVFPSVRSRHVAQRKLRRDGCRGTHAEHLPGREEVSEGGWQSVL